MEAIDFDNSYMTFFGRDEGNIARIRLDAACTLTDGRSGESAAFYLIAPCRAERMYRDDALFQLPNYEFCGIFAAEECLLIRTHPRSDRDNREYGRNSERFDRVELDIRRRAGTRLDDRAAIVAATLENRQLNARTELRDDGNGWHAVLEYPVKTMNVLHAGPHFQVDTGPLLLPDSTSAARPIERFDLAYVAYHSFEQAEFILRRPVAAGDDGAGSLVTDYSTVRTLPARNEIVRLD